MLLNPPREPPRWTISVPGVWGLVGRVSIWEVDLGAVLQALNAIATDTVTTEANELIFNRFFFVQVRKNRMV